ncbi:stage III sporulation protein AH [Seinonella peptonophila]|uniref:Stage III sporulation protein AH n=1 Tax=Seinonella peptonophila TaxID=112248 RepID=A0A1M4TMT5_9BACL|nr:SpoIIIAH-like family protein [Seinonella peptonophila]SHE45706.1 stage III sporulation protein AH [Seinonella peptonophila]
MTVNKQTVWLVSMLTLMVALSAYYIVTGPSQPVQQANQMMQKPKLDLQMKEVEQGKPVSKQMGKHDYFVNYHLQRDTLRSKLTEEYMRTLSNPRASEKELKVAEQKVNQLMKVDQQESSLEEAIRKEGYRDVVVMNHQNKVDVIVQGERLTSTEAVHLISMVGQHFRVDPTMISIGYRS